VIPTLPAVSVATPEMRPRIVRTVVTAFAADPAFQFFFPRPETFEAEAAEFAGHLFDQRVAAGTVWVVEGGGAVAMWDGPDAPDKPAGGEPDLPVDTRARLDEYHEAVRPLLPPTRHWYLGILATAPEHAGRRWGRAVMAAGRERARDQALPAYLETTNPANVDLYRRSGWTLTAETAVGDVHVWVLRA
jgi:GNAT superfamily N-acetyltransferase